MPDNRSRNQQTTRPQPQGDRQADAPAPAREGNAAWNRYVESLQGGGGGGGGRATPGGDPSTTNAANEARAAMPRVRHIGGNATNGRTPAELLAGATELAAPARGPIVGGGETETEPRHRVEPRPATKAASVYQKHDAAVGTLGSKLTPAQAEDVQAFIAHWNQHRSRYEAVSAKSDVPAPLIAAIHWRESTGNFGTYLHQGDPLGRPAVHVPRNIPVFHVWEDAAVHALTSGGRSDIREDLGMGAGTRDSAALATFAEMYNGLGYHNKGKASPYVYSGTDAYQGGKYVRDGHYSARAKDQQVGVVALLGSIGGMDSSIENGPTSGPARWESVKAGRTLQAGMSGPLIEELQARLAKAGYPCGSGGTFDDKVAAAVKAFEKANGFPEDAIVGPEVAKKLDA